ncbi:hypothetical protein ACK8P5_26180 (plasmid) [Paenibacillus sp. EC2-1]|uniref:hypothetical protein n=1 Tax=Paenibacillus sp. EC2-1 TaxID=3388665 RepID=UPI003BEF4C14
MPKEQSRAKGEYGLSGFLAPDGVFYPCSYLEHSALAKKLIKEYDVNLYDGDYNKLFIKFGCDPWTGPMGTGMCHVFMFEEPTPDQLEWLNNSIDRATDKQRRIIEEHLDSYELLP